MKSNRIRLLRIKLSIIKNKILIGYNKIQIYRIKSIMTFAERITALSSPIKLIIKVMLDCVLFAMLYLGLRSVGMENKLSILAVFEYVLFYYWNLRIDKIEREK